ncbi:MULTISPECIES: hypothetical protein [Listeria]|uniref:hypothetical protein n=1 Tax=Listeria TaxID=1637 RepID=UPI0016259DE4|nr:MULTISPECIES: hypothetical protein [Listeria]MBC2193264.1 hypothetical protein [Listeria cossartiae subsp. cossartiae]MCD2253440.1 hypothetical protein [Listeria marthii]
METAINLEAEAIKACDAFMSVHAKKYAKMKHNWDNAKKACMKEGHSIRRLARTSAYMSNSNYHYMADEMNKFLYVYFRNKPYEISEEQRLYCKAFVQLEMRRELESIFK